MNRAASIAIFFTILGSAAAAAALSEVEEQAWPWFPWTENKAPPQPEEPAGKHQHPHLRFPPTMEARVKKCWSEIHTESETCARDVMLAFWTKKPALGAACCAAIEKVSDDCFHHYNNPFFAPFLRFHCAAAHHHHGAGGKAAAPPHA